MADQKWVYTFQEVEEAEKVIIAAVDFASIKKMARVVGFN